MGFAYGATFNGGCEQIKDAPFGCVEWWFSRYQTLIAIFGAIFVAWLSVQPILKRLQLSSVQTAVALQQVHADREKRLEAWLKPERAALGGDAVNSRSMGQDRLDISDIHANGDRTGTLSRTLFSKFNKPLAIELTVSEMPKPSI